MRTSFTVILRSECTAAEAWRRIVDVRRHGDVVPLTAGAGPAPEELRVGDRLVARTAVGRFGFDDVMTVRAINPGESVVLEKVGRVITGEVWVSCADRAGGGSSIHWHQEVSFPFLPRFASQLSAWSAVPVLRRGYQVMLGRLLGDTDGTSRGCRR